MANNEWFQVQISPLNITKNLCSELQPLGWNFMTLCPFVRESNWKDDHTRMKMIFQKFMLPKSSEFEVAKKFRTSCCQKVQNWEKFKIPKQFRTSCCQEWRREHHSGNPLNGAKRTRPDIWYWYMIYDTWWIYDIWYLCQLRYFLTAILTIKMMMKMNSLGWILLCSDSRHHLRQEACRPP